MDLENQNFEKIKKTPHIIILQMCDINDSHMMYGYNTKNQNFEKIKTLPGDIITLYRRDTNDNHMMYGF